MTRAFISYRRADSAGSTRSLHDALSAELGDDNVFMDVDDIAHGEIFEAALQQAIRQSTVVLVVIGKQWLDARDDENRSRLANAEDHVRREIELALAAGIRVVPVLVDGAQMPRDRQLPDSLKPLAMRNGVSLRHARFQDDVQHLLRGIRSSSGPSRAARDKNVFRRIWAWLYDEHNRGRLVLIGGGFAAMVAATWTVFVFLQEKPPIKKPLGKPVLTRLETEGFLQANRGNIEQCMRSLRPGYFYLDFVFTQGPGATIDVDILAGQEAHDALEFLHPRLRQKEVEEYSGDEALRLRSNEGARKLSVLEPDLNGCIVRALTNEIMKYKLDHWEQGFIYRYITSHVYGYGIKEHGSAAAPPSSSPTQTATATPVETPPDAPKSGDGAQDNISHIDQPGRIDQARHQELVNTLVNHHHAGRIHHPYISARVILSAKPTGSSDCEFEFSEDWEDFSSVTTIHFGDVDRVEQRRDSSRELLPSIVFVAIKPRFFTGFRGPKLQRVTKPKIEVSARYAEDAIQVYQELAQACRR